MVKNGLNSVYVVVEWPLIMGLKGLKEVFQKSIGWFLKKKMILEFFFMQREHFAVQSAHVQHHHQNCKNFFFKFLRIALTSYVQFNVSTYSEDASLCCIKKKTMPFVFSTQSNSMAKWKKGVASNTRLCRKKFKIFFVNHFYSAPSFWVRLG